MSALLQWDKMIKEKKLYLQAQNRTEDVRLIDRWTESKLEASLHLNVS